ncbi:MAG: GatB/YqeY domain-containing protein [Thermoanaerobaculia bacterium]
MPESPRERISKEIQTTMKAGDKVRLSALRMLLTEIQSAALRGATPVAEVDEAGFQAIVRKAIKQRRESAEQFRAAGRAELAEKEEREAEIFAAYLPQQLSEEELRRAMEIIVAEVNAQGAAGPAAIGGVMKATLGRFGSAVDGATVNRIARELLAPR